MISASFFSQKIEGIIVYGLSLHNDEKHMQIHCGQNLEKAIIMYEALLSLKIA